MNKNRILPDDPRLTAYALGEMPADERHEFEQMLAADEAARQVIAAIRETAAALHGALEQESSPNVTKGVSDLSQAAIIAGRDPRKLDGGQLKEFPKFISFPYWKISGLAAACFTVFFIYWQAHEVPAEKVKHYVEVPLVAASASVDETKPAESKSSLTVGLAKSAGVEPLMDKNVVSVEMPTLAPASPAAKLKGEKSSAFGSASQPVTLSMSSTDGVAFEKIRRKQSGDFAMDTFKAKEGNTEAYAYRKDNDYQRVADQPLSTFSIDVDTAAYANVRRFLAQGQRPPVDAVRIEELVNYFPYDYAGPESSALRGSAVAKAMADKDGTPPPFKANLEVASAPWAPEHRLVRIGLKGREVSDAARPAANLVFLLDVSGSMNAANKLPLVKQSLRLLIDKLRPDDRVAIAVYAGASGLALPSTPVARRKEILDAIDRLQAEGSTNGAMGIHLAYDIAKANFITGGVNRVLLATDGDFNVGVTSEGELVRLIEEKAKSGVFLSVLGFGVGNLKDSTMEQLADKGNGNYAYIDSLQEAKKCLVEQAGGTLVTIAKDVKIQVEFNPAQVAAYRLIGYENRLLAKEDFNNDKIDAGEIGAGHTVTALYEVVPVGTELPSNSPGVDDLKYSVVGNQKSRIENQKSGELLTVKIRYKEPTGDVSSKLEFPLRDNGQEFAQATQDFKFAAAVAGFGMALRDSPHKGGLTLMQVAAWGRSGIGRDAGGYRAEFVGLVERAQSLAQ